MRILIDIGHPAHVHLFKNFAWLMQEKGHKVHFTTRDKEFELYLLDKYNFSFTSLGKHYTTKRGKIFGLLKFNIKLLIVALKQNPDIYLSHGSIYASHVSWLLRKPHIALEDTGNSEQVNLYLPFTSTILTTDIFNKDYGKKQIRYRSHHEVAYLHPKYFHPSPSVKSELSQLASDKIAIIRFVSWNATHDHGQSGISDAIKIKIIERLRNDYRVYISAESILPESLEEYRITISPEKIHDMLYIADLFIGEGTTMAMEAAVLGTPSIYINSLQYDNVKDMESFGLLYRVESDSELLITIEQIIKTANKKDFKKRRTSMLTNKINLTSFLIWFIETYPQSVIVMQEDPSFQNRFQ